jgi:rare lipoprotein A
MILRLGAAICVGAIVIASPSSPIARPADQNRNKLNATAMGFAISGIASTYNPFRSGYRSGGTETASGEPYDPAAWTAAIQSSLRDKFGGVRYGKNYRPTYALVTSADKQAVVKVDDVGPLEPGRVIDLNEQTMLYFDPSLRLGLIRVTVTPLRGDDWSPGPVAEKQVTLLVTLQEVRMKLAHPGKGLGTCDL